MAYQSKHTGSVIDNAVTEHSDINQDIIDINSQISQLNTLINNLNTSLTNSINTVNNSLSNYSLINHTHSSDDISKKIQMPNYSSVITSKSGSGGSWYYTATENCYVYFTVSDNTSTNYTIDINGTPITRNTIYSKTGLLPLAAGDTLRCSNDNNGYSYYVFRIRYV